MDRSRIKTAALISVGLLTLISACAGAGNTTTDTATPSTPSTPSTSLPPNPTAPAALQFTAPAVGGGTIDFTQYAGQTVALWFWAPT